MDQTAEEIREMIALDREMNGIAEDMVILDTQAEFKMAVKIDREQMEKMLLKISSLQENCEKSRKSSVRATRMLRSRTDQLFQEIVLDTGYEDQMTECIEIAIDVRKAFYDHQNARNDAKIAKLKETRGGSVETRAEREVGEVIHDWEQKMAEIDAKIQRKEQKNQRETMDALQKEKNLQGWLDFLEHQVRDCQAKLQELQQLTEDEEQNVGSPTASDSNETVANVERNQPEPMVVNNEEVQPIDLVPLTAFRYTFTLEKVWVPQEPEELSFNSTHERFSSLAAGLSLSGRSTEDRIESIGMNSGHSDMGARNGRCGTSSNSRESSVSRSNSPMTNAPTEAKQTTKRKEKTNDHAQPAKKANFGGQNAHSGSSFSTGNNDDRSARPEPSGHPNENRPENNGINHGIAGSELNAQLHKAAILANQSNGGSAKSVKTRVPGSPMARRESTHSRSHDSSAEKSTRSESNSKSRNNSGDRSTRQESTARSNGNRTGQLHQTNQSNVTLVRPDISDQSSRSRPDNRTAIDNQHHSGTDSVVKSKLQTPRKDSKSGRHTPDSSVYFTQKVSKIATPTSSESCSMGGPGFSNGRTSGMSRRQVKQLRHDSQREFGSGAANGREASSDSSIDDSDRAHGNDTKPIATRDGRPSGQFDDTQFLVPKPISNKPGNTVKSEKADLPPESPQKGNGRKMPPKQKSNLGNVTLFSDDESNYNADDFSGFDDDGLTPAPISPTSQTSFGSLSNQNDGFEPLDFDAFPGNDGTSRDNNDDFADFDEDIANNGDDFEFDDLSRNSSTNGNKNTNVQKNSKKETDTFSDFEDF